MVTFYSIYGLHLFNGAIEFRCRTTSLPPHKNSGVWDVYENLNMLCG